MRARLPWGLMVSSAVAFVLLCALGVWQVRRLHWKEGLIAAAAEAERLPPAPLSTVLAGARPEFRRVTVTCPGLSTAPYIEMRAIEDQQPGVRLISACRQGGGVLLVDRGFVADVISARPPVSPSTAPTRIEGQLRAVPSPGLITPPPSGRTFFALDRAAMAQALGEPSPAGPYLIFATSSSNPEWLALKPSAPPPAFSNNHLGYAITWFGLALALAGVSLTLIRRRLKR